LALHYWQSRLSDGPMFGVRIIDVGMVRFGFKGGVLV